MVPPKVGRQGVAANVVIEPPAPKRTVPKPIHLPLLILLSTSLSALLYSIASEFSAGDLSSVSRSVNDWPEVLGLLGCKALEVTVGYVGDYDSWDIGSLTLLSHLPPLYLLSTFYHIRPTTVAASLAIDILATALPFRLLRPRSPAHNPAAHHTPSTNRAIIRDRPLAIYTSLLAAAIHAVLVFASFGSWLPVHLVTHFDGLRDLSAAHAAFLPFLILSFLPTGFAARTFLFTPAAAAAKKKPRLGDGPATAFNPETATLGETVWFNVWGYSPRTKTLIRRTVVLAAVSFLNTWLHLTVTVEGSDSVGAAGWASIWAAAAVVTGAAFLWVGDTSRAVK